MGKDDLMKTYELLCNHYKLQNDSMEKGRTFFWLVESGLFLSWYKISCPMINVIIMFAGIIITISWFIVFVRFRKAIDITTDSLKNIERRWLGITNKPNICTKEDNAFRNKRLFSQRLWMDELHPLLFLIA